MSPERQKIFFNGTLQDISQPYDTPSLLSRNYVYAAVNTFGHRPLYTGDHLELAVNSYEKLYGLRPEVRPSDITVQITELLSENRMSKLGNIVHIYLIPPEKGNGEPDIMVKWNRATIYSGYELISIRPKAILTNYEIPFAGHRTAVSLITAEYMQEFAERQGCHTAIRNNRSEKLVSCGEYPLFLAKDGMLFTPPAPETAPLSVERKLMYRACEMADITINERHLDAAELPGADEVLVFNHTGLQSVLCWGSYYFYNLIAKKLDKVMKDITLEGYNR